MINLFKFAFVLFLISCGSHQVDRSERNRFIAHEDDYNTDSYELKAAINELPKNSGICKVIISNDFIRVESDTEVGKLTKNGSEATKNSEGLIVINHQEIGSYHQTHYNVSTSITYNESNPNSLRFSQSAYGGGKGIDINCDTYK